MSDDVSMNALSGSIGERTTAAIAAGCDLALHCNGKIDEMRAVAANVPVLAGDAKRRADAALALRSAGDDLDIVAARARFSAMMATV
jgi:beta-N-acetylhexosaminidase